MGTRSMAGQLPLEQFMQVRILRPQRGETVPGAENSSLNNMVKRPG